MNGPGCEHSKNQDLLKSTINIWWQWSFHCIKMTACPNNNNTHIVVVISELFSHCIYPAELGFMSTWAPKDLGHNDILCTFHPSIQMTFVLNLLWCLSADSAYMLPIKNMSENMNNQGPRISICNSLSHHIVSPNPFLYSFFVKLLKSF